MGKGEWSGQLTKGYHQLNTRQDSVESATSDLWIDSELPLEQQLAVPQTSEALIKNIQMGLNQAKSTSTKKTATKKATTKKKATKKRR